MVVTGDIVKEISRIIAEHLRKPKNLATLERCRKKRLSYEYWLHVEILNALTDVGLHPKHLEMCTDAPCMLTEPPPDRNGSDKWCDWVLHAIKEQEYLWVELKAFSKKRAAGRQLGAIRYEMRCLDLFDLERTFDLWKDRPLSALRGKELRERAESLRHSTHRGVCILSGITDFLENKVLPHRLPWSSPAQYEISGPFALWVWDRPLKKVL